MRGLLNFGLAIVIGLGLYRAGVTTIPTETVFYGGSSGPCEQAVCRTQRFFDEVTGLPVGMVRTTTKDPPFATPRVGISALLPPDAEMTEDWRASVWFGVVGGVLVFISLWWLGQRWRELRRIAVLQASIGASSDSP